MLATAEADDSAGSAVFALIKPAGVDRATAIVQRIHGAGFTVVTQRWIVVSPADAEMLYPDVFATLAGATASTPHLWDHHVRYLGSRPSLALQVRHHLAGGHRIMSELKGRSPRSLDCAVGTIRRDYPGPAVFNAFHSASTPGESAAMIDHFGL